MIVCAVVGRQGNDGISHRIPPFWSFLCLHRSLLVRGLRFSGSGLGLRLRFRPFLTLSDASDAVNKPGVCCCAKDNYRMKAKRWRAVRPRPVRYGCDTESVL